MMKSAKAKHSKTYDEKRKAQRHIFNLYLDDEQEKEIDEMLKRAENKKQLIIKALAHYKTLKKYKNSKDNQPKEIEDPNIHEITKFLKLKGF